MGNNRQEKCSTNKLVYGTWALVVVTLIGIYVARHSFLKQIEMQWRPFAIVDHIDFDFMATIRMGESNSSDSVLVPIDSIDVNSPLWLAVKSIEYGIVRRVKIWNMGRSPMRITRVLSSTITPREWFDDFNESPKKLASAVRDYPEAMPLPHDIIILPDSLFTTPEPVGFGRRIFKEYFEEFLKEGSVHLYPYTYLEYEDFFNHNRYNIIFIQEAVFGVSIDSGKVKHSNRIGISVQKSRWDIW